MAWANAQHRTPVAGVEAGEEIGGPPDPRMDEDGSSVGVSRAVPGPASLIGLVDPRPKRLLRRLVSTDLGNLGDGRPQLSS
jgi:hypothetical protein